MIKSGKYNFEGEAWDLVSEEVKDLISKMLEYDKDKRISAEIALKHVWIGNLGPGAAELPLDQCLINMRSYSCFQKLKKAALTEIASQLQEEEIGNLKAIFLKLDANQDGFLTYQELKEGLKTLDPKI